MWGTSFSDGSVTTHCIIRCDDVWWSLITSVWVIVSDDDDYSCVASGVMYYCSYIFFSKIDSYPQGIFVVDSLLHW